MNYGQVDNVDQTFNVQFSNQTDLTFAQQDYKPVSESNTVTFGGSLPVPAADALTLPALRQYYMYYGLTEFSFGKYNLPGLTGYWWYESIMNQYNTTTFSMETNGLLLPTESF